MLPADQFHHRDHIRLAWIYWQWYGNAAGARIAEAIKRYAAHLGKSDKYHATMTHAWMRLVADRACATFEETIVAHPELLDKEFLRTYYSQALLDTQQARSKFVEPDLKPLPLDHAKNLASDPLNDPCA